MISPTVVIIGAGAAGLQASALLKDYFCKVTILEARDYVGGRIKTSTSSDSVIHDEGAAWVHGIGTNWEELDKNSNGASDIIPENPMIRLLLQQNSSVRAQLDPVFARGNPWIRHSHCLIHSGLLGIYRDGSLLPKTEIEEGLDHHNQIMQRLLEVRPQSQSLHDALEQHSPITCPTNQQHHQLHHFLVHLLEIWYAGSASDLSLYDAIPDITDDSEYAPGEGDYPGAHCTVKGGMRTLLEPLLISEQDIQMNQVVTDIIDKGEDGIEIRTQSDLTLHADACIVTIPAACLKVEAPLLNFDPALPDSKRLALEALRVGSYKKILLEFSDIWWDPKPAFIGFLTTTTSTQASKLGRHVLADNLWARHGAPCIELVLVGDAADWAYGKTTEAIKEAALEHLELASSNIRSSSSCTACHVTQWEEDPFSRGAYSTFMQDAEEHAAALQKPEWGGKLVFGGEHTVAEYEGSVHAALLSGETASKHVIDYLDSRRS